MSPAPDRSVDTPPATGGSTWDGSRPAQSTDPFATAPNSTAEPSGAAVPRIGHYDILGEIARGGMGVVYKARHQTLDRIAAVKLILSGAFAHPADRERFRGEAKIAAQLDHPGIVPLYEVGEESGQPFLAMAFIDGHSLWQEVKESPLPPQRAAGLMRQITEAMQYAHDRGIVHRDLKPQNILLTKDGQPKVTDFGLAKRQESDATLTETGQPLGTPSYMPPEQARGELKQIGRHSDVYSLGATLYCLLTGRPPFQAAKPIETMLQVVEQEPVSPRDLNPLIPKDLETICLKCLEKDPAKRYGSARALAEELARFEHGEPILARPVSRLERTWRWCRRNPVVTGLATAVLLALTLGLTVASWQWRKADAALLLVDQERTNALSATENERKANVARNEERTNAEASKHIAQQAERQASELAEKVSEQAYAKLMASASQEWELANPGKARELLAKCPEERRGLEWYLLNDLLSLEDHAIDLSTAAPLSVDWSREGPLIAVGSSTECLIVDAETQQILQRIKKLVQENIQPWNHVRFNPVGTLLVGSHVRDASVVNPITGEIVQSLPYNNPDRAVWSPSGTHLALSGSSFTSFWDTRNWRSDYFQQGASLLFWDNGALVSVDSNVAQPIVVQPGGAGVTYGETVPVVENWSKNGNRVSWANTAIVAELAPQPNPRMITAIAEGAKIRVTSIRDYSKEAVLPPSWPDISCEGHSGTVRSLSWSPDGKQLASCADDNTYRVWNVGTRNEPAIFRGHDRNSPGLKQLAWSPEGSRIASIGTDSHLRIWRPGHLGKLRRRLDWKSGQVAWKPGSNRLAIIDTTNRSARVWDADIGQDIHGELPRIPQLPVETILAFAWEPIGKSVTLAAVVGPVVQLWRDHRDEPITCDDSNGTVDWLKWSHDRRYLAGMSIQKRKIQIWDAFTGKQVQSLAQAELYHGPPVWHPSKNIVAAASGDKVLLCMVDENRTMEHQFDSMRRIRSLHWDPLGIRICAVSYGLARVYSVSDWSHNLDLPVHNMTGESDWLVASWSPDGSRIIACGKDAIIILDSVSGAVLLQLKLDYEVRQILWSENSQYFALVGHSFIEIWTAKPDGIQEK